MSIMRRINADRLARCCSDHFTIIGKLVDLVYPKTPFRYTQTTLRTLKQPSSRDKDAREVYL